MKHIQHLPTEEKYRKQDHQHRHQFAETHASPRGFELPGSQVKNIQRSKAEYDRPKNAVDIAVGATRLQDRSESNRHRRLSMYSLPGWQCSGSGASKGCKQRFGSEKAHNKYHQSIRKWRLADGDLANRQVWILTFFARPVTVTCAGASLRTGCSG